MSRNADRKHLDQERRIGFLEQDMDALEGLVREIKQNQERQSRVLMGILVSVITGVLLYGLQTLISMGAAAGSN